MGASKNRGTPKWMVYNGNPYKNGWFWGIPIFGNTHWFLFEILLPKKFSYSCFHGAPLLPAFIWRFLPEYTFNQQKIHFLARVSSARHIQSLDVDEELLLSVSFSFSKFILPRFLAAFSACLRAAFHILQSFCWMRNWNLSIVLICYFGRVVRVECAQCI